MVQVMINRHTKRWMRRAGGFLGKTTAYDDLATLIREMRVAAIADPLVRFGPRGDGGYLIPDLVDDIVACFSPGVANSADFELALAEQGIPVFLADRSVEAPPVSHPAFSFTPKFLSSTTSERDGLIRLDDWIRESMDQHGLPSEGDILLQMDIEGAEYEVLHSVSDQALNRCRIIVVEFHKLHQLADRFSFGWMAGAIRRLLREHVVVHLHPNNNKPTIRLGAIELPATLEATLLRRDYFKPSPRRLSFPHPADAPCVPQKPDLVLPGCWYE